MIQAQTLSKFLEILDDSAPDINVLLFTGYKKESLVSMESADINNILSHVDTLIDGPFEKEDRDTRLIR